MPLVCCTWVWMKDRIAHIHTHVQHTRSHIFSKDSKRCSTQSDFEASQSKPHFLILYFILRNCLRNETLGTFILFQVYENREEISETSQSEFASATKVLPTVSASSGDNFCLSRSEYYGLVSSLSAMFLVSAVASVTAIALHRL